MSTEPGLEIAVDIGGTFTDLVGRSGPETFAAKVPSRPGDLAGSVADGIAALLQIAGRDASAVRRFIHSTTVATNAVLERKGAVVGLLATDGFEDVLEIGRQKRSRMYELFLQPETPTFLAPGRRRVGIPERIDGEGRVLQPLDEALVIEAASRLVDEEGVEVIAICFLFSFVNPAHERRARELIKAHFPKLAVSLSSEVDPVFREYERTCATAFDAYVRPVVHGYLETLGQRLRTFGVSAPVEMMQSRGGIASATRALERPIATLLCGPAAGAVGGSVVGRSAGFDDLITLDIGGTSTDVSVVRKGVPTISRGGRIAGYPLRVPMVDVHAIGAGGGSIAHIDAGGALKVGPESAGAEPGPICYGRGGESVTVTDASLLLGYLHPDWFAADLALDRPAAEVAMQALARSLGLTPLQAALGVHTVVNAAMADAIRTLTVRRGLDPRDFVLILLGGAGPVHGGAVASELSVPTLVVPPRPGVLAAEGLLYARTEAEAYRTFTLAAASAEASRMRRHFDELTAQVRAHIADDGIEPGRAEILLSADMRYQGQSYDIEVPIAATLDERAIERAVDGFRARYRQLYGHGSLEDAVEFVNLRAVAAVPPAETTTPACSPPRGEALIGRQPACFDVASGMIETPVYRRDALAPGTRLSGPAIIVQRDTTTVLRPRHGCTVDAQGNLIIALPRDG